MANEISLVTYSESLVTPKHDAVIHDMAVENGILYGCKITIKDATTLHMTAGMGIVYGRQFELYESDITISLADTTVSGRLYVHVDLGNIDEPAQLLVETGASLGKLVDNPNINVENSATDMELVTFEVTPEKIGELKMTYQSVRRSTKRFGDLETKVNSLESRLPVVEQETFQGIGQSYLYVADKPGYVLITAYNYAYDYNDTHITEIAYNAGSQVYVVQADRTITTDAEIALRLIWVAV